ncbi:MAG TPA: hypothetical protein V6C65_19580 [Allocoleopsis sp.]
MAIGFALPLKAFAPIEVYSMGTMTIGKTGSEGEAFIVEEKVG